MVILWKQDENDYGYAQMGYQKLACRYADFNQHIVIYVKSGEEIILEKLQNSSFRKILIELKHWLTNGFSLNHEKGERTIRIDVSYPEMKMREAALGQKTVSQQLDQQNAQLKFSGDFLARFDD